jgi:hypothetical protein
MPKRAHLKYALRIGKLLLCLFAGLFNSLGAASYDQKEPAEQRFEARR